MKKMMKIIIVLSLILVAILFTLPSQALAVPVADWSISHTWMADNVVWIGAGDPSSPLWENLIQSYSWNPGGTVDISGGSSFLWGNQWYLKVWDQVGRDSGWIVNFDIKPGDGNTYVSPDHPTIWDYHISYAYIQMPGNNLVPEPATMLLLGSGLIGLGYFVRKRMKK